MLPPGDAFGLLEQETEEMTQEPTGVGLDVPGVNGRLLHVMPSVAEARWAKTLPAWFAKHPVRRSLVQAGRLCRFRRS